MKIALAQMKMKESVRDNLNASLGYIARAAKQGADLIFFPELQLSPFFPSMRGGSSSQYLMKQDGEEISELCRSCMESRISASVNVFLRENGHNYDASLMISNNGEILGVSKMVHIASFPHFYESEYYTPSDTGFRVYGIPTNGGSVRVGVVICFDRHFPESIRCCALMGAELIIIPTANLTDEPQDMFLWELRVQAVQNCVCIAMCNRVGAEGDITFCGGSVIIDHKGAVTALADGGEQLLTADIDTSAAVSDRLHSPYFTSRRPEKYGIIAGKGETL